MTRAISAYSMSGAHMPLACQALIDDLNLVATALKKDVDLDELSALISSDCG
jgi:hypothetical protein